MWRKGNPCAVFWGMQIGTTSMESTAMEVPQKIKKLPYGIAIPFLGINMKETKILAQKDITIPMFIAVLFAVAKI